MLNLLRPHTPMSLGGLSLRQLAVRACGSGWRSTMP